MLANLAISLNYRNCCTLPEFLRISVNYLTSISVNVLSRSPSPISCGTTGTQLDLKDPEPAVVAMLWPS
jgi:hypothetical protein